MNKKEEINKLSNLSFEGFKDLAKDNSLSKYQKIGFPNSYREGYERAIFEDIVARNPNFLQKNKTILDIGPGCSELIMMIIDLCEKQGHQLYLIDSKEMLDLIPDKPFIHKTVGRFPEECTAFINENKGFFDTIIVYSVFHYIFTEGNIYNFIDNALPLLGTGGSFFLGDIPNVSKRQRFFATEAGIKYHQNYTQTETLPPPLKYDIHEDKIDDGVLLGLITRYRNFGLDAYILPQPQSLPMANRREDILILKN